MTFIDIAREFLTAVKDDLDPYTTQKGKIEVGIDSVTLLTPSHIQFAKYGRGPGKAPPVDPLEEWVIRKGIVESDKARGVAFGIAKSISLNGTLNWVPNAPNALDESIDKYLNKYDEETAKLFNVIIADEMKKIQPFPETIPVV